MNKAFWKDKKILITGHTGFKGSWLAIWLKELGADIIGFSLESNNKLNNFNLSGIGKEMVDINCDIRNPEKLNEVFNNNKIDIVFHLAAQSLVLEGYNNPTDTYTTNVNGTLNLLEAIKKQKNKIVGIFITTDKVYENKESMWGYKEIDSLGGFDPYSSSKACCEILINSYRESFFNFNKYSEHQKSIATVRAGNVIGGGDWAKNRIIPDIFRAIDEGNELEIRNPNSVRPWQHVLEPLAGYLLLAEKMWTTPSEYCEAWNFGPEIKALYDVKNIVIKINNLCGGKLKVNYINNKKIHETNILLLDITKSMLRLNWNPLLTLDEALDFTAEWYKQYKNKNVLNICVKQISNYMSRMDVFNA